MSLKHFAAPSTALRISRLTQICVGVFFFRQSFSRLVKSSFCNPFVCLVRNPFVFFICFAFVWFRCDVILFSTCANWPQPTRTHLRRWCIRFVPFWACARHPASKASISQRLASCWRFVFNFFCWGISTLDAALFFFCSFNLGAFLDLSNPILFDSSH